MSVDSNKPIQALSESEMKESAELFVKHNHAINMEFNDSKPKSLSYHWYFVKEWVKDHNPFAQYKYVSSPQEYIDLPWKERSVWYFWYMDALVSNGVNPLGRNRDRKEIEEFIKKNHYIQYHIRRVGSKMRYKFLHLWDETCYFLKPRQKWLIKKIPNSWADKTWLIPEVNFAMVIDFIEGEEALDVTNWEGSSDQAGQFEKELKDCYDYIKNRRPQLQKDYENSYPDEDNRTGKYEIDYAEHTRIELLLNKEDTKYLVWIVTNRDFFWT